MAAVGLPEQAPFDSNQLSPLRPKTPGPLLAQPQGGRIDGGAWLGQVGHGFNTHTGGKTEPGWNTDETAQSALWFPCLKAGKTANCSISKGDSARTGNPKGAYGHRIRDRAE